MAYTLGPMLAGKFEYDRVAALLKKYGHLIVQPKIDGFRLIVWDGIARSRSWKAWTNRYLQQWARDVANLSHGMDGEFYVGKDYKPEGFRDTMSGGRAEDGASELGFFWFDYIGGDFAKCRYQDRFGTLADKIKLLQGCEEIIRRDIPDTPYRMHHQIIPSYNVTEMQDILELEEEFLGQGFEGAIIRTPMTAYKFGRGTPSAGPLIKMKRFEDAEAVITGYEPRYHNANELQTSELGYAKRTSHQENQIPEERVGAFYVHILKPDKSWSDIFKIGVFKGFTLEDRAKMWGKRDDLIGEVVKFSHQGYGGGYSVPRLPVLLGFRNPVDLS